MPSRQELKKQSDRLSPLSVQSLPLAHVTEVGSARDIVENGQIEARFCKVFGKKLVYFFLLKPAYRSKAGDDKSDYINYFPFVFIASPDNLGNPYHVYPFDTGGAADGKFDDRADKHVHLEDFELEPSLGGAGRHLAWAFGSIGAYFDGELRPDLAKPLNRWEDVPLGFISIARLAASGANQPDRRASAIEIAYRDHVAIKGNVKLVILPKQYLENGDSRNTAFLSKLKKAGIEWITYNWQPNTHADQYQEEISRLAREYYKRAGLL